MDDQRIANVLGYGLFGLGTGLTLFSFVYLILMRGKIAQPESTLWLLILLAIVLVPTLIGAAVGATRARQHAPPAPY